MIDVSNHLDLLRPSIHIVDSREWEVTIKTSGYSDPGMGLTSASPYKPQTTMVPSCSYSNELKKWFWKYFQSVVET